MKKKPPKRKKNPPIYLLDHKMKWATFKTLQDKLVRDSGPTPVHGDKVLWEMMRDKKILCWFDPLVKGDMGLGFKLPKGREVILLTNKTKV